MSSPAPTNNLHPGNAHPYAGGHRGRQRQRQQSPDRDPHQRRVNDRGGPYNTTRHGVVALSEGLYLELKAIASPVEVSVLCPGWVKTRIMDFEPDPNAAPMTELLREFATAAVENGMAPAEVADQVSDAIVNRRFWILTLTTCVNGRSRGCSVRRNGRIPSSASSPKKLPRSTTGPLFIQQRRFVQCCSVSPRIELTIGAPGSLYLHEIVNGSVAT